LRDDALIVAHVAQIATNPSLESCLIGATLEAMQARGNLESCVADLKRAEALVHEQPIPPERWALLVPRMQALRACLKELMPFMDGWAESEVCLRGIPREGQA